MSYFVVRDYSHTDKQCLLKVLSRNMVSLQSAVDWADTMKRVAIGTAKTKRQKKAIEDTEYYVVQRVDEDVEPKAQRLMFQGWKVSFRIVHVTTVCEISKEFPTEGVTRIFHGEGRSMNEAFDDANLKLLEFAVEIPHGWRRVQPNECLKTSDRRYAGACWLQATKRDSIFPLSHTKEKHIFIRKDSVVVNGSSYEVEVPYTVDNETTINIKTIPARSLLHAEGLMKNANSCYEKMFSDEWYKTYVRELLGTEGAIFAGLAKVIKVIGDRREKVHYEN